MTAKHQNGHSFHYPGIWSKWVGVDVFIRTFENTERNQYHDETRFQRWCLRLPVTGGTILLIEWIVWVLRYRQMSLIKKFDLVKLVWDDIMLSEMMCDCGDRMSAFFWKIWVYKNPFENHLFAACDVRRSHAHEQLQEECLDQGEEAESRLKELSLMQHQLGSCLSNLSSLSFPRPVWLVSLSSSHPLFFPSCQPFLVLFQQLHQVRNMPLTWPSWKPGKTKDKFSNDILQIFVKAKANLFQNWAQSS